MFFLARAAGSDMAVGFCGGDAAWELSRNGRAAHEAFARDELVRTFGGRARG